MTYHVGDFLPLRSGERGRIQQIYTHRMQFENRRRIFVAVQLTRTLSTRDDVLDIDLLRMTMRVVTVGLAMVGTDFTYLIPISQSYNGTSGDWEELDEKLGMDLLDCRWNVSFL